MVNSSCPCCQFILKAAQHTGISVEDIMDTQVLLQREKVDENRVYVIFIAPEASDLEIEKCFQIRLCDANGRVAHVCFWSRC